MQAHSSGAICGDGQRLLPRNSRLSKPARGHLSNGTEETKGNELTLEAFKLCKQLDLNFVGNVEGHDLFHNRVDVVICDGSSATSC